MTRCLSCNGIMQAKEKSCFGCGAAVVVDTKSKGKQRFAGLISILFIASLVLTVASLFWDKTPPFVACGAASLILMFVKRSADSFTSSQES
jgi:hypothetical protein